MSKITTSKFKSGVEWLSKPSHAIVVGVLLILVIAAIWFATKKIKSAIASVKEKMDKPEVHASNLTPGLNHRSQAEVIYVAMGGGGTNEAAILGVLAQMRTQDDWNQLQIKYADVYNSSHNWYNFFSNSLSSNLIASMQSELREDELSQCREVLVQNGIDPGF